MCIQKIIDALRPRPTVVAWICEDTGLLAGAKCSKVAPKRYYVEPRPGEPEIPADVCDIHEPAPEPEPEPQPEPEPEPIPPIPQADHTPPRTGMDFYQAIAFPLVQVKKYLDDLVVNGGSLARFFGDFVWPVEHPLAGWRYSLFRQVGWYTEHGGPYDGREYPLYTIARSVEYGEPWNEVVWEKYRAIFQLCAERKIRVTWSVLDGCSMKNYGGQNREPQTRYQPLLQNVQHHGAEGGDKTYTRLDGTRGLGYSIHTGGIYGGFGGDNGAMKSYLPFLIDKAVRLLRSVPGLDWRIMPGNEMERRREGTESQADVDGILHDWHEYWITYLIGMGVRRERIVLSITGTNSRDAVTLPLVRKYGVIEQVHGPNSDTALLDFLSRFPGAEIDGDGQDKQAAGYTNGMMRLPSIDQCRKIRSIIKDLGLTYQTLNAHTEPAYGVQDIGLAGWAEQRALAGK